MKKIITLNVKKEKLTTSLKCACISLYNKIKYETKKFIIKSCICRKKKNSSVEKEIHVCGIENYTRSAWTLKRL